MSQAIDDIVTERARQISREGWTPSHDDEHGDGSLAQAAACYCVSASGFTRKGYGMFPYWPFDDEFWKPKNPRRDLVRAAALIVAEIERLDRCSTAEETER